MKKRKQLSDNSEFFGHCLTAQILIFTAKAIAFSNSFCVLALAFFKYAFTFEHISSIGEKSGEYGGSQVTFAFCSINFNISFY